MTILTKAEVDALEKLAVHFVSPPGAGKEPVQNLIATLRAEQAKVERLREALELVTGHFAAVMGGPMVKGAGVEFANGVEGIPTIKQARAALKETQG